MGVAGEIEQLDRGTRGETPALGRFLTHMVMFLNSQK